MSRADDGSAAWSSEERKSTSGGVTFGRSARTEVLERLTSSVAAAAGRSRLVLAGLLHVVGDPGDGGHHPLEQREGEPARVLLATTTLTR